jgi:hypothetical protein
MKLKIEIKSRFTGSVLFSYEKENNTMKDTIEKAIKEGANLFGANLVRANLVRANLESANLFGANLESANLESANLESANLESANLFGANLVRANLFGANLVRANLESANLFGANLVRANQPIFCRWTVSHYKNEEGTTLVKIGCKHKTIEDWVKWFESTEQYITPRGSDRFKMIHGMFLAYKIYLETIQK